MPRAQWLLSVLDGTMIGPHGRFLAGEQITLADYLGLGIITVGEAAGVDYTPWPNLRRWLHTMKARPAYATTHAAFHVAMRRTRPVAVAEAVAA